MDRIPEISSSAVVLLGSFNPTIFQPEWFARQKLLPVDEAEKAIVKVVVPQVCQFETERFYLQVTNDRFQAGSKPNTEPASLPDLVGGTFFILEHTPVKGMGLNRAMHFALGSEEQWHQFGDILAPKQRWNEVLKGRPGMRSLSIQTVDPNGSVLTVKVEPSAQVKFGVYFDTNQHYSAPEKEPLRFLMETLKQRWESSQEYASKVATHIIGWVDE